MSDRATLDTLIHDAEHAELGAGFARRMGDAAHATQLARKAAVLRSRAAPLAEQLGVELCQHGRIADECVEDPCYEDDLPCDDSGEIMPERARPTATPEAGG